MRINTVTTDLTIAMAMRWCAAVIACLCVAMPAQASDLNAADTAFMMFASVLVMLMTPAGLALFYGGLTQHKNVLNTIGMNYAAFCLAFVAWCVVGYSLAFSTGNAFIGGLDSFMLLDVELDSLTGTIPTTLFVLFQGTFAAIAVAIVSGAIIERVRFSFWAVFCVLWVLLCYAPIAHWVWGGGLLSGGGEMDFAGGTVVHISAGVSGLVLALLIGRRRDDGHKYQPYSILLSVLGSALLWFGWFGFNAGSALAANALAANAMLLTCIAGATGCMAWMSAQHIKDGRITLTGMASGVVAGLVGITPASGYVGIPGALFIGLGGGLVGWFAVDWLKHKLGYDDALDAFGIHGVVGIFGTLATGMLANPAISPGNAGVLYGNWHAIVPQLVAVAATVTYAGVVTAAIYWLLRQLLRRKVMVQGLSASLGMDVHYHGERANAFAHKAHCDACNVALDADGDA